MGECFEAGADNLHFPTTTFTAYRRARLLREEHDRFAQLHQRNQFAVDKAEIAGAAVTFGQDMLNSINRTTH